MFDLSSESPLLQKCIQTLSAAYLGLEDEELTHRQDVIAGTAALGKVMRSDIQRESFLAATLMVLQSSVCRFAPNISFV